MNSQDDIFSRTRLLLGDETLQSISRTKVIVFGAGGVGSWCAEGLVRSGISKLTVVDCDRVAPSNVNRQLMATVSNIGRVKVEALKERLLDINPMAEIIARCEVFNDQTAESFNLDSYDYIIDCIDSLKDKALLIQMATRTSARFYSSMGAALKLDPTRIGVAEFWKVRGCPLARSLRQKFKRSALFPAKKFLCVYSDELLSNKGETLEEPFTGNEFGISKARINGSLMHITSIFGLTISGLVISDIATSSPCK